MQQIFDILFKEDEVTWREMLLNLVKSDALDPWDVDIHVLTNEYIKMLSKLKELDFRISGKVILAAALLLRIKSDRLLTEDIASFDQLMHTADEDQIEEFYEDLAHMPQEPLEDAPLLVARTPQLKKRRVSIYDVIEALESALETSHTRKVVTRSTVAAVELPKLVVDISTLIEALSKRLSTLFSKQDTIAFSSLTLSPSAQDKVLTFMPLLYLAHIEHRVVDLEQESAFGEIMIRKANPES